MVSYDLHGRVAFVTGAAQSIGAACARTLARNGARVAVTDIDGDGAERTAGEIRAAGGEAIGLALDVTDPKAVTATVQGAVEHFGALHIGVNNAGISGEGFPTGDIPVATWRAVLSVNLDGVFYCTRAEIAEMRRGGQGGSIVNMASILSRAAFPSHVPYTAAKHGVLGLTRGAAVDHAVDRIRVNAVAPGFIRTPLNDIHPRETIEAIEQAHPLGRMGEVDEVAELVAWLASDASSFTTGSLYPVDGGYLAR